MNLTKLTDWGRRRWACPGVRAFCLAFLTACIVFVPFMIFDGGYFLFYGDFNVQQVPFYQMLHDAIRSGNWGWSWTTDLGANQVGSYTFYNLTSPFFWLTIPFPNDWVPFLMAPLLILKNACPWEWKDWIASIGSVWHITMPDGMHRRWRLSRIVCPSAMGKWVLQLFTGIR